MARLNTFPVSIKVAGRRIIIVGGDEEALAKARLAAKTSAEVVLFSEHFEADFSRLDVALYRRPVEVVDFANAALAFIADHGAEGARALKLAREAGVPVNEVDVPQNCDFFTPAIVDRAPISIAIGSEGEAPVLARLVRAKIEAMLSPRLGELARLAGLMREKASILLSDGTARRRYYEALVTAPAVEDALVAGEGEKAAEALLAEHAQSGTGAGVVWLIGAGPGAEDLLTLRAQRLLQEADVIVHDHSVPGAVIEMGRRDAERISVAEAGGPRSFTQAQRAALIVRLAREGKKVARLWPGDTGSFRFSAEFGALQRSGIAHAVVPGVAMVPDAADVERVA